MTRRIGDGRVWGSGPRLMVSKAHTSAGTTAPNSAGGEVGSPAYEVNGSVNIVPLFYFDMTDVTIKNRITTVGLIVFVGGMFLAGMLHPPGALLFFVLAVAALPAVRLRAAVKWPLALVLSLSSCGSGFGVAQTLAEKSANDFCERFQVGQEPEAAAHAASDAGDPRLRRINSQEVWVGYTGGSVFDRHFCIITAEEGRIVKKQYSYMD